MIGATILHNGQLLQSARIEVQFSTDAADRLVFRRLEFELVRQVADHAAAAGVVDADPARVFVFIGLEGVAQELVVLQLAHGARRGSLEAIDRDDHFVAVGSARRTPA